MFLVKLAYWKSTSCEYGEASLGLVLRCNVSSTLELKLLAIMHYCDVTILQFSTVSGHVFFLSHLIHIYF